MGVMCEVDKKIMCYKTTEFMKFNI